MTGILNIVPATRDGSHVLLSFTGPSGSGKTYTALVVARGLVGPKGRIGFLDLETGRGRLYAGVTEYSYAELTPPFSPYRLIQAIGEFEEFGCDCLIIDSASHEWEGIGGCHDMAESTKKSGLLKWQVAKAQHKRFVNRLLASRMHIITTLRAREKYSQTKDPDTGRDVIVNTGYHEIQERQFIYEQTVSVLLLPGGRKVVTKCPEDLIPVFGAVGVQSEGYLTQATGSALLDWIKSGKPVDAAWEQVRRRAQEHADLGTEAYRVFFTTLSKAEQKRLAATDHENLKSIAAEADERAERLAEPDPEDDGDDFPGTLPGRQGGFGTAAE
jgi:DNA polymerase III delta prime subunit